MGERQAAGGRGGVPRREAADRAERGAAGEPGQRDGPPELRDERQLHQPGAGADRAVQRPGRRLPAAGLYAAEGAGREGGGAAPGEGGSQAYQAVAQAGGVYRGIVGRAVQARPLPLLIRYFLVATLLSRRPMLPSIGPHTGAFGEEDYYNG